MILESEVKKPESPLKRLRQMLGVTQVEFAALIGVAPTTVARWEQGIHRPSFTPGQWRRLMAAMATIGLTLDNLPDDLSPGNNLILSNGG